MERASEEVPRRQGLRGSRGSLKMTTIASALRRERLACRLLVERERERSSKKELGEMRGRESYDIKHTLDDGDFFFTFDRISRSSFFKPPARAPSLSPAEAFFDPISTSADREL